MGFAREEGMMKLKILDRVMIVNVVLPVEANLIDAMISRAIRQKTELTPADLEHYEVKQNGTAIVWNKDKDTGTEIDFEKTEIMFLKKQVERLDSTSKIPDQALDICLHIKELKDTST
jgi:hypothetical protein